MVGELPTSSYCKTSIIEGLLAENLYGVGDGMLRRFCICKVSKIMVLFV